ncbi:MAG: hydrolase [Moraxellaceae bacterium]|nr:hydrolase [Moraxellaceae bacterium]
MPFTPLHMGPGLLMKALLQGSFSVMVFGWAQILIDIEPLVAILRHDAVLHGWSHTWIGATVIALVAALTGKPAAVLGLRLFNLSSHLPLSWPVAFVSAFIGTWSHVLLDSVMHADMLPWRPLTDANPALGLISTGMLHLFCLVSGVLGMLLYPLVQRLTMRRN